MNVLEVLAKILRNILTALYEPFGFSLLLSFLAMFFYLYAYEPQEAGKGWKSALVTWYQKFKESVFFRKLFFLAFVTSLVLFRTLLNRSQWMNPLADIMGGWGIWETVNGEQKLTTECIENVIMMVPFSAVVAWTFEEKIGSGWKKILWQSGKIAFIFSISIEMLQLLLRLGTFQLSDMVIKEQDELIPEISKEKIPWLLGYTPEGQAEMKRVHDLWKDVREHLEKNGTYCRLRKFEEWVPLG